MKVLDINGLSKLVKKVKDFVSSYVENALPTRGIFSDDEYALVLNSTSHLPMEHVDL